jgi:hypothetical protein
MMPATLERPDACIKPSSFRPSEREQESIALWCQRGAFPRETVRWGSELSLARWPFQFKAG